MFRFTTKLSTKNRVPINAVPTQTQPPWTSCPPVVTLITGEGASGGPAEDPQY